MLIDTSVTIAYKCPSCGSFKFFSISVFQIFQQKNQSLKCDCGGSTIEIIRKKRYGFAFLVPCIGCEGKHLAVLSKSGFVFSKINTYRCTNTGIELCFIGKDYIVRENIDKLEKEFDKLIDMLGYDSYFKNTQVMYDSLNKIHDIAEEGNLFCECGNNDIEIKLLSDKIYLKCKKCSASRDIYAISNEHLKDIQMKQEILIHKGMN